MRRLGKSDYAGQNLTHAARPLSLLTIFPSGNGLDGGLRTIGDALVKLRGEMDGSRKIPQCHSFFSHSRDLRAERLWMA